MADEHAPPDLDLTHIPIERLDLESDKAHQYVVEGRPFVTRISGWRALEWDIPYLKDRIGANPITLTRKTGEEVSMPIAELLDLIQDPTWLERYNPPGFGGPLLYLRNVDNPSLPETKALLSDFELPAFIRPESLSSIQIWAQDSRSPEHGFYDSGLHVEPNAMSNLNLQVLGKKQVWLFPPHDSGSLAIEKGVLDRPPYWSQYSSVGRKCEPPTEGVRCHRTVLEPGDAVFIPAFWFHWFVHYHLFQLNLNFWFVPDRVELSPMSSAWAFSNALADALGGFQHVAENYAKLPDETKALLRRMEESLLEKPALLSTREMLRRRVEARTRSRR
jgi:hypothetical protein